ncbi:MAG: hypothetical protein AAF492_10385, partial [Verrucomicrobiota bacterium]
DMATRWPLQLRDSFCQNHYDIAEQPDADVEFITTRPGNDNGSSRDSSASVALNESSASRLALRESAAFAAPVRETTVGITREGDMVDVYDPVNQRSSSSSSSGLRITAGSRSAAALNWAFGDTRSASDQLRVYGPGRGSYSTYRENPYNGLNENTRSPASVRGPYIDYRRGFYTRDGGLIIRSTRP